MKLPCVQQRSSQASAFQRMMLHPQHITESALIYGHRCYHLKKEPIEKGEKVEISLCLTVKCVIALRKTSPVGQSLLGQI